MPIKELSEIRRMPRAGKVRLGVKVKGKNKLGKEIEYPKATDYFVVHADESTPVCNAEAFARVYPGQPKELDVVIPCDNIDLFFPQWYKRYASGTGLVCKGDGEVATEVNRTTGEMFDHECLGKQCQHYIAKACRPVGSFMFMLPKVDGLACWQLDTGSFHSIVQLNSGVAFIKQFTRGRISGILLKLVIRPKQVQAEGKKKTVYVVDLVPPAVSLDALLSTPIPGMQRLAAPDWTPEERKAAMESVFGPDPNERQLPAPPRVVNGDTGEVLDVDEPTEQPPDFDDPEIAHEAPPTISEQPRQAAKAAPKPVNGEARRLFNERASALLKAGTMDSAGVKAALDGCGGDYGKALDALNALPSKAA